MQHAGRRWGHPPPCARTVSLCHSLRILACLLPSCELVGRAARPAAQAPATTELSCLRSLCWHLAEVRQCKCLNDTDVLWKVTCWKELEWAAPIAPPTAVNSQLLKCRIMLCRQDHCLQAPFITRSSEYGSTQPTLRPCSWRH
jgi:hypothetical protein